MDLIHNQKGKFYLVNKGYFKRQRPLWRALFLEIQGEWPTPRLFSSFPSIITIISSMISLWWRAGSKRHKRSARRSRGAWKCLGNGRDAGASTALARGTPRRGGRGHQQCNTPVTKRVRPSGRCRDVARGWEHRGARVGECNQPESQHNSDYSALSPFYAFFIYCGIAHNLSSWKCTLHILGQLTILILLKCLAPDLT